MVSLRKTVTLTHRWVGLTLGLFAVVLAVTGASVALRLAVEGRLYHTAATPPGTCAEALPLDDQVAVARGGHPKGPIATVRVAPGLGQSTIVRFTDGDTIYVDPCTGATLGREDRWGGVFGRLEQLHRLAYWQNGPLNKLAKGSTALALAFIAVLGGLYLWWPRRHNGWRQALTVNGALRRRAFALNLHWTTGFYTGLIIFTVACTALPIAFDWAKQGLYLATGSAPPPTEFASATPDGPGAAVPYETALRQLRTMIPAPATAQFRYPRKPGGPIEISAVAVGAPHGDARNALYLDAVSGAVLAFQPYNTLSRGRKLYLWMLAIHTGQAGGWPVDLLLVVGMLGVPVMAYTGIDSWLRSRRRKKA